MVTRPSENELRIQINPQWRDFVVEIDLDYLESLLQDLKLRAAEEPEALFRQLSSLSVGPVITHDAGESLADHPQLLQLCNAFVDY